MTTLVDCRFSALRAKGYEGTTSDMIREWLFFEVNGSSPATGHVNDLWEEFLKSKGFWTGQINDSWYAYLGSLGYEGQINDRERMYWCDQPGSGPTPPRTFTLEYTNEYV